MGELSVNTGGAQHVARHHIDAVAEKEGEGKYGFGGWERAPCVLVPPAVLCPPAGPPLPHSG